MCVAYFHNTVCDVENTPIMDGSQLDAMRTKALMGGGEAAIEKQHAKKLTAQGRSNQI
jgi:hypothetical protein